MNPNPGLAIAQSFEGLPMKSLIGGPLIAATNANSQMALTQTEFLLKTCFTEQTSGSGSTATTTYEPIMIEMTLTRGVLTPAESPGGEPTIQSFNTSFHLPLLTIVPLNSLAVNNVEIDFQMEVKSSSSKDDDTKKSSDFKAAGKFSGGASFGPFSVHISGSVSYDHQDSSNHDAHYQNSNSAKYTVKCTAGQLPLPKGVNVIIEAFAQSIQPVQLPAAKSEDQGSGNQGGDNQGGGKKKNSN